MTTPPTTPPEVLSDGSLRIETTTTVEENDPYDIQIQGSDRKYPAIILRRKYRGVGATIQTISRFGQHSALYSDFSEAIQTYVVNREKRLRDKREEPTTRDVTESTVVEIGEGWIDKALQSVVERRDNTKGNTDSI